MKLCQLTRKSIINWDSWKLNAGQLNCWDNSKMDYKLKAISNNVNSNDTIVDPIKNPDEKSQPSKPSPDHVCHRNVPVLFASKRGVHLRRFDKSSPNQYSASFCDLERWVRTSEALRSDVLIDNLYFRTCGITSSRLDWRRRTHPLVQLVNQLELYKRRM